MDMNEVQLCDNVVKLPDQGKEETNHPRRQGSEITFNEIVPWGEEVNSRVFLEIAEAIQEHMHITEKNAVLMSYWAAHTHMFESFNHTPRLAISAPAKGCGKTVALTILGHLVTKPLTVDNVTPGVFFRMVNSHQPTFLIDECDVWLNKDNELPAALNGGFESGHGFPRCVGEQYEVRLFNTHTPVALAGINVQKRLTPSTLDRCILIQLEKASRGDIEAPWDKRNHTRRMSDLGRQLARWLRDQHGAIEDRDPELHGLINRPADKWRPLFAIAEIAGGEWPNKLKECLEAESDTGELMIGEALLKDILWVLEDKPHGGSNIFPSELLKLLHGMKRDDEESRWLTHNFKAYRDEDKPLTLRQLNKLLKEFGLKCKQVRCEDATGKGFERATLHRIAKKYVS